MARGDLLCPSWPTLSRSLAGCAGFDPPMSARSGYFQRLIDLFVVFSDQLYVGRKLDGRRELQGII
jgi:hypothetical protein